MSRAQRIVTSIYSRTAHRLYEPLVVHGSFPLLGADLHRRVAEQGASAVRVAAGAPILDVPVGTAYFTAGVAASHPGLVVGADIAEGMVQEARGLAIRRSLSNLVVVQANAHALPFADASFGAILCTNGLQVIPGLRGAVRELARVLAPGGKLFVSVVGLPLGAALPARAADRMPTVLAARSKVAEEIEGAGLEVVSLKKRRLATFYEAIKPGRS
ncbi:MAG TPA: methyltransferase domain-containing protein [Actinomycetota bacterium]|nr:methyltransferase domain-containing protein [Actinomycetota bacterium]